MTHCTTRRRFLGTTAAAGLGVFCAASALAAAPPKAAKRRKALIGRPDAETLEKYKSAGFDGIEANTWNISEEEATKYRRAADSVDMRIHSVLRGWTNFNSPDSAKITADIATVEKALRTSQIFGADALLLVPCRRLAKVDVPKPEDFQIKFDETTGHVNQVVPGDNTAYEGYINAQNEAVDMSRRAIERLIPAAEKTGVVIALENVWSDLWVKPKLFVNFVNSFQSKWVQSYFDIGNHVKYASPEEWIAALGTTIVKVHVKDFVVERTAPNGGRFVNIREGDVNWPAVMKSLAAVGYDGWMTIEGSRGLSLEERSKRLDLILAGK